MHTNKSIRDQCPDIDIAASYPKQTVTPVFRINLPARIKNIRSKRRQRLAIEKYYNLK